MEHEPILTVGERFKFAGANPARGLVYPFTEFWYEVTAVDQNTGNISLKIVD